MAVLLFLTLLVPSIVLAGPDDGLSPSQRRLQRGFHDRVGWHLVNGVWMRASGQCEWSDLVRLNWDGQQLAIDPQPINAAARLLRFGRTVAIDVGAAKDLYQIAAVEIPPGGFVPMLRNPVQLLPGERGVCLTATELPELDRVEHPRPLRPQSLVAAPRLLRVSAVGDVDGKSVEVTFISQQPQGVRLKVREVDAPLDSPTNFAIDAPTLDNLHRENYARVRKYLSPMLRILRGPDVPDLFAPGAADVYEVFAEIEPTSQASQAVRELLPAMVDPNYDTRMGALASLRKLGPAGVCAIARLKRDELAPQQALFIEQVLKENARQFDRLDATQIGKLRRDPFFLADCLEFPDARVRAAALRELRQAVNREVKADAVDVRDCARLANELREQSGR